MVITEFRRTTPRAAHFELGWAQLGITYVVRHAFDATRGPKYGLPMTNSANAARSTHYILSRLSHGLGHSTLILTRDSPGASCMVLRPLVDCLRVGRGGLCFREVWDAESEEFITVGVKVADGRFDAFRTRSSSSDIGAYPCEDPDQAGSASFMRADDVVSWIEHELQPAIVCEPS